MKTTNDSNPDAVVEKEVIKVLDRLLKAQERGDTKMFSGCFARDETFVHIGTDQDEKWYDLSDFFSFMETQLKKHKGSTINKKNTTVHHNPAGDVAWYSQLLDRCPETKGDDVCIEGFRHTGVMEKRDGKWLIVQSHISFPYVNDDQ